MSELLVIMVSPDYSSCEKSRLEDHTYSRYTVNAELPRSSGHFEAVRADARRRLSIILLVIVSAFAAIHFLTGTRINVTLSFPSSTKAETKHAPKDYNWVKVSRSRILHSTLTHHDRHRRLLTSTSTPAIMAFSVQDYKCHLTTGMVRPMPL